MPLFLRFSTPAHLLLSAPGATNDSAPRDERLGESTWQPVALNRSIQQQGSGGQAMAKTR
jgi:hypothetical protein